MRRKKKKGPGSSQGKSCREWSQRNKKNRALAAHPDPRYATGPNRKGLRCEHKVWHDSVPTATTVAMDQLRTKGRELFVYFCRGCDGFHLTSKKSRGPWFRSLNQEILETLEAR